MTFSLQWLKEFGSGQQYDSTYNPNTGAMPPIPNIWSYNASSTGSNDATAAVEASGYFNGALGYLKVNDLIYVACNDANHLLTVATNNGTTVTTTAFV